MIVIRLIIVIYHDEDQMMRPMMSRASIVVCALSLSLSWSGDESNLLALWFVYCWPVAA